MMRRRLAVFTVGLLLAACGGDSTGPGTTPPKTEPPDTTPPPPVATALSKAGGDEQTTTVATALAQPLKVKVVDQRGDAMAGVQVSWEVTAGGGSLSAASSTTGSDGVASVTWTLGPSSGANTARASVEGLTPVDFSAEAIAFYTVMVYLAADNDLARFGVLDIEEMEAIGSSDSVNVVVQGEFSPIHLQFAGCANAACVNLPNFNTFRYRVAAGPPVLGPNGPVTDIGNRDMTSPAQLAEFITWAKTTYPAEKYFLVLWNHGGGYQGLIADETSAPGHLMSLADLRQALTQAGGNIDVIDFDMCLMAGVETALAIDGLADFAVFSEENEPGDGDPYAPILGELRANPRMSPRDLSALVVDEYLAFYQGGVSSVTKSAVDLSRLAAVRSAWGELATEMTENLATYSSELAQVIPETQNYNTPFMRDLGDFLLRLEAVAPTSDLTTRIDALQDALAGGILVRNGVYTSTIDHYSPPPDVSRSTGLHVVLPSGLIEDALPSQGPLSFAAYQGLFLDEPWTGFLEAWLAAAPSLQYFDQGNNRLHTAILWDDSLFHAGAEFDFWVLEPNGNLYIPFLGTITPNGSFNGDSYATGLSAEIYSTRRYVEQGTYHFFGELYDDPANAQPELGFFYTTDQSSEWSDLYADDGVAYPVFSKAMSWRDDPDPTAEEILAGAYTDLQYLAYWDVGTTGSQSQAASVQRRSLRGDDGAMKPAGRGSPTPSLTREQRTTLGRLLADPQVRADRAAAREAVRVERSKVLLKGVPSRLLRGLRQDALRGGVR